MANVCLDRSDSQRLPVRSRVFEYRGNGGNLDGVSGWRSRAVRLKVCRVRRVETGSPVALTDQGFLRLAAGRGDGFCFTVLIHSALPNDCTNRIAIVKCIVKPLQDYGGRTLPAAVSVCATVECVRLSILGDQSGFAHVSPRPSVFHTGQNQKLTSWMTSPRTCPG